ncbi:transcriptional regulator TetR family [Vibrio maritimus]|uniref:Transcriptional regulator TetR family n=1 Tax=Vibrio maritimus TaxID=990268 RepID=A0A090RZA5_9VIBR|nr:transcriptional regulator TetR family [Vibrio maritimus]
MKPKNNKGRPAQISKDDVIQQALSIGLAKVSMHSLGKELGVSATALYRHVDSKESLIVACCDYIMEQVPLPRESNWEETLYSFSRSFRQALLAIPGSVDFIRHNQQFTSSSCVLVDHILGFFIEAGLKPDVGFMAFASVFTRVTDIVQHQEQSLRLAKDPSPTVSHMDVQHLPNLAQFLSQTQAVNYDHYFEDGIKITIEGLKAVYGQTQPSKSS